MIRWVPVFIATAFGLPNDQSEDENCADGPQDKDQSDTSPSVSEGQPPAPGEIDKNETEFIVETPKTKGKLKDATVADQMIKIRQFR